MHSHPFLKLTRFRLIAGGVIACLLLLQWGFLVYYIDVNPFAAFIESLFSVGIFAVLGYYLWYASGIIQVLQAEIIVMGIAMVVWIAFSFTGAFLGREMFETSNYPFLPTLPIRIIIGMLCWTILAQWYKMQRLLDWKKERLANESIKAMQTEEINDRIAVKDGSRIHIIQLDNLIYVQASGDYITLVSPNGQFLKEQTMKSLESQLPSSRFIRVHRSFIVNIEHIKRVELHGKETYRVLLKNGDIIKASQTGYKLLKEQLAI